MPKLPQSMFKSRENVANLPSFVHAKSSLLFGLCAVANVELTDFSKKKFGDSQG